MLRFRLFLVVLSCALASADSAAAGGTENSSDAAHLVLSPGAWRTRVQSIFDPKTRVLQRRSVKIWDPVKSADFDFTWTPLSASFEADGRVNGRGRLTWRPKGAPAYDATAIVAAYDGEFRDGRFDGIGTLTFREGPTYEGRWVSGRIEGAGLLRLDNGAEYRGMFHDGVASGDGVYVDVTGERYEGMFRDGLRTGVGETVLPNNFKYRSTWVAGREVAQSRKIRVALRGGVGMPDDDIRIGVVAQRAAEGALLQYMSRSTSNGLSIMPDSTRLMQAWKGHGDIGLKALEEGVQGNNSFGIYAIDPTDRWPVRLSISVQNRGAERVAVSGLFLDVASSVEDVDPALQMAAGEDNACGSRNRPDVSLEAQLQNFGIASVRDATIKYGFGLNGARSSLGHDIRLPSFARQQKVDFGPDITAEGASVSASDKHRLPCQGNDYNVCVARLVRAGRFGKLGRLVKARDENVVLDVAGTVDYSWLDAGGAAQHKSSPFTTTVLLGRFPVQAECGEGGGPEPLRERPVALRIAAAHYRLPVAFEKSVPAGQIGRYTLDLKAPKSSDYDLKIVVRLADGREIASQPIHLIYFVPTWTPAANQ